MSEGSVKALIADTYEIEIPVRFGKYDFIRTIGYGSFSVVALVVQRGTQNQFACKICSRELLMTNSIFDRFEREVRIMETLKHPSLVQLEEVVFDEKLIYLIMEYCSNGELFQIIADHGRLEEDLARKIFSQIVDGMIYIHARDIAHRDLKPENILLDANMNAKIADFGLCHQTDQKSLLQTPCGSPFYAPPEVITNQPYDGKLSDVWSLGVVLFTIVTGSLPWQDANQNALFRQIIDADFQIPRSLQPQLRDLISRLMRADPNERPPMAEIAKHPWLTDCEVDLFNRNRQSSVFNQSSVFDQKDGQKIDFHKGERRLSSFKRPIIVRPTCQNSATVSASFSKPGQIQQLIRRVPPSSAKRNSMQFTAHLPNVISSDDNA